MVFALLTPLLAAGFSRFLRGSLEVDCRKIITRPALIRFVALALTKVRNHAPKIRGTPAARFAVVRVARCGATFPPLTGGPVE
jgi:hypothetical protein